MNKLTQKGFYRFIKEQPADRKIKHTSSWCGCAVGEYARHVSRLGEKFSELKLNQFAKRMLPNYLYHDLNFGTENRKKLTTYGKLAEFISKAGRI